MIKFGQGKVLFIILFVIPLLGITFYEFEIASDRYLSQTSVTFSRVSTEVPSPTVNLAFLSTPRPSYADYTDALAIVEFIMSRDMLHYIDEKLHVRDHYSSSRID